jgi:hypothetical protein
MFHGTSHSSWCCSRRNLLTGALTVLLAQSKLSKIQAGVPIVACASFSPADSPISFSRRASSDNPKLDEAVINELKKITAIMPINPQCQYIDEDVPNSFALPTSEVLGTKGTVLLGLKLLKSLLSETDGAAAIAGICAHECGHIRQYFSESYNHLSPLGVVAIELHADLIAGYYMGKRGDVDVSRVRSFETMLFNKTGYAYTDPNFHGFPEQRLVSVQTGYHWAADKKMSFEDACTKGEAFIKSLLNSAENP